jgi:hypothetical protein
MTVDAPDRERKPRIGGWLLLLCMLLLVWQPISFALVASTVLGLGRIASRGAPLVIVLAARVVTVGFGIAAGLALLGHRPGAVALAKLSLALTAALDVFVYLTPYFPTNLPPGDAAIYAAASVLYAGVWIVYLTRSKRARAI